MKQFLCLSLLAGLATAALADQVLECKTGPAQAADRSILSLSNGQVTVNVADAFSPSAGRFTIGTADGRRLLYGHGDWDPATSYPRFRVDGLVYAPIGGGAFDYEVAPTSGPEIQGGSIVTGWMVGGVQFLQTVTPTMVNGSGTVRIEYSAQNIDPTAGHEVSILLEMDTQVNANDRAPISTSNGYVTVESCYTGAEVPNTWQAFESGPDQDPSLLSGCGILNGFGATLPDFAAFGQWGSFYSGPFDYVCSGAPYGDSGCLLLWNSGVLLPDQLAHYQTYYGTCTTINVPGELSLSLTGSQGLSCQDGEINPNPFDVNLLVTNTGSQPCYGVMANLMTSPGLVGGGILPVGDLYPGQTAQVGFFLTALDQYCGQYGGFFIEVTSQTCPTNGISRELYIPCCEVVGAEDLPVAYGLGAAYPNPFNPATTLSFTMAETGLANLSVHNLTGETVATLWNGPAERGTHEVLFDASRLPSGLYLYTLSSEQGVQTRKMVLAK